MWVGVEFRKKMIQKYTFTGGGGGGWLDQVGLKLTQSPTGVGVGVGTELGNIWF